ncbi:MAG: class I SAM-dependent methyltransferase [Massiliimalia sp.]|jgi:SAM-dependent methyltransferase
MEFRKIFDTIPEQFDAYRPRYCPELFSYLISQVPITPDKSVLEIGPGTGQATDPILQTGCDYHAIELGEHLAAVMERKYSQYSNFHLIQDDFITHDFGEKTFDFIYSAATIQWIPEEVAFSKTFALLKPGGILAMMFTLSDYKTPNPQLYQKIQDVYSQYFKPDIPYTLGSFCYENALKYGYTDWEQREFHGRREMTAETYAGLCQTHCDHLVIPEPYQSKFFEGIKQAVLDAGNHIVFYDTFVLMTVKKDISKINP